MEKIGRSKNKLKKSNCIYCTEPLYERHYYNRQGGKNLPLKPHEMHKLCSSSLNCSQFGNPHVFPRVTPLPHIRIVFFFLSHNSILYALCLLIMFILIHPSFRQQKNSWFFFLPSIHQSSIYPSILPWVRTLWPYQVMAEIYTSLLLYSEVFPSQMANAIHPVGFILTTVSPPSWPCREDLQRDASMRHVQTTKTPRHFNSFVWASNWPPTWRGGFIQTTITSDSVYVHLFPLNK